MPFGEHALECPRSCCRGRERAVHAPSPVASDRVCDVSGRCCSYGSNRRAIERKAMLSALRGGERGNFATGVTECHAPPAAGDRRMLAMLALSRSARPLQRPGLMKLKPISTKAIRGVRLPLSGLPLLAALPLLVVGCEQTAEGVRQDAKNLEQTAKDSAKAAERDMAAAYGQSEEGLAQFERETEQRLQQIDQKMAQLEKRVERAAEDAKADMRKQISELEKQRKELGDESRQLRGKAHVEWKNSMKDLRDQVGDLEKRLDKYIEGLK